MAIDYIIAALVLTLGLVLFFIRIISDQRPNKSNNDGGLPVEFDFPELDLPPGVTLPVDSPSRKKDKTLV
ncbi:MAG: hypothetical protein ACLFUB_08625 [Cyclobacteriaceae bacterium]